MAYPIKNEVPQRRRRFDVTPDLLKLQVGQSIFVPGLERGYPLAARASLKTGRKILAMRDRQEDVEGTTFWCE